MYPTKEAKARTDIGEAISLVGEGLCHLDYTPDDKLLQALKTVLKCYGKAIVMLSEAVSGLMPVVAKAGVPASRPPDVRVEYLYSFKASRCPNSSRKTPTMHYACLNILGHTICAHIPRDAYAMLRDRGVRIEKAKRR